ncbi:hypothetical protein LguiA_011564 [Lonicera macranthoides]
MELSSFSTTSRGCWPSPSEVLVQEKIRVGRWYQGSISILPSKRTLCPLSVQPGIVVQKGNRVLVPCCQKRETPVVEAGSMDEIYDALAGHIVPTAAVATDSNYKYLVGLAGPPGAGKSTVAYEVARRVNKLWPLKSCSFDSQVDPPGVATVLPMDGFHLYCHQLDAMQDPKEAHARRGAPWTFNPELLLTCLKNLRSQGSVYAPSFDHGVGDPVEDDIFVNLQHKVVIVEGNYLLLEEGYWKEISSIFDEKWFIDIDIDRAMQRVLKRHISTGKTPDTAKWRAKLINKSKKNADLVIKSNKGTDDLIQRIHRKSYVEK